MGPLLMDLPGMVCEISAIWEIFAATFVFSRDRITDQIPRLANKNYC